MINLSPETEILAKRLADAQKLSVDDAIRLAIEERARAAGILSRPHKPRDQSPEAVAARHARTNRFVAELAALPILDPRSPGEITDDLNAP
jgi:antitoxin VapB